MEVGTVVHVFVRDVADHQKCAECAKKLYDYQYTVMFRYTRSLDKRSFDICAQHYVGNFFAVKC